MWKKKLFIKSLNWSLALSSFVGAVLSFALPDGFRWIGLIIVLSIFLIIAATIYFYLRNVRRHKISSRGSIIIEAMYGNILEIKKGKNEKTKPVVVIPVNSSFDTIVENDQSIVDRIVEGTSIHGQWLDKYYPSRESICFLDKAISKYIKDKKMAPIKHLASKRGKKDIYKLGSHVYVERDDYSFLLFALTEFDERNKVVKKDADVFADLMKELMDITDECAGKHVYIPVMGTKIAMFGLNELSAFEYIKNAALNKKSSLRADISIVIFEENRDKVSIYD